MGSTAKIPTWKCSFGLLGSQGSKGKCLQFYKVHILVLKVISYIFIGKTQRIRNWACYIRTVPLVLIWQCLTWLETEMDFSLKAVSDLNWKNVERPTTENGFCLTNVGFLPLRQFLVWNLLSFQKFQSLQQTARKISISALSFLGHNRLYTNKNVRT